MICIALGSGLISLDKAVSFVRCFVSINANLKLGLAYQSAANGHGYGCSNAHWKDY